LQLRPGQIALESCFCTRFSGEAAKGHYFRQSKQKLQKSCTK
jgi:hypothetical protein